MVWHNVILEMFWINKIAALIKTDANVHVTNLFFFYYFYFKSIYSLLFSHPRCILELVDAFLLFCLWIPLFVFWLYDDKIVWMSFLNLYSLNNITSCYNWFNDFCSSISQITCILLMVTKLSCIWWARIWCCIVSSWC